MSKEIKITNKQCQKQKILFFQYLTTLFVIVFLGYMLERSIAQDKADNINTRKDFNSGKEIVCSSHSETFIISKEKGWSLKNNTLSNGDRIFNITIYCNTRKDDL